MSRQERVQMPIGQKTGERGQNAPPEEHLHNPERIRLREPMSNSILTRVSSECYKLFAA